MASTEWAIQISNLCPINCYLRMLVESAARHGTHFVMTEPSVPGVSTLMSSSSNPLPSTSVTFLAMSAALPAADVRRIAQEVASILGDTPSYNPLTSTSATGVTTLGKLCLCFFRHSHIIYIWFHFGEAPKRAPYKLGLPHSTLTAPSDMYVYIRILGFAFLQDRASLAACLKVTGMTSYL